MYIEVVFFWIFADLWYPFMYQLYWRVWLPPFWPCYWSSPMVLSGCVPVLLISCQIGIPCCSTPSLTTPKNCTALKKLCTLCKFILLFLILGHLRSPESLRWPVSIGWLLSSFVMCCKSCIQIFSTRTTGQSLPNLIWSTLRGRNPKILNFMTPTSTSPPKWDLTLG